MAKLSIECKKLMVKELVDRINDVDTFIITSYKGLSAEDFNKLRKEIRGVSGEYVVVKDSMIKRAISEGPYSGIDEFINGDVGLAIYRDEDPTYISKILVKFSKDHEVLNIRGGFMNGRVVSKEIIFQLAQLPSKEALRGKLANVLDAPIQGLAGALYGILSKLAYALNAVRETKDKRQG